MTTTEMKTLDDRTLETVTGGFVLPFNPDDLGPGPAIPPSGTVTGFNPKFLGPGPALPRNDHGMDDLPYGVGPGIILPQ
ncbi:hypothetical protein [Segnochrobactrum spirostomi]|uniref:Uncharacterized protein n=1 Tax=Segnochrobactrum spirostomi TaxID=2608987 RepID=A0A6A7Y4F2_9HYPH|nr:hypothetical protein [Segnochrobactrum spirostomi]MQT13606.1 hypothetical protein [Segnochrobactrum spirostomi]